MGAGPDRTTSDESVLARRGRLERLHEQARQCARCPQLAASRTTVVFGTGDGDAALMLVGAPSEQNEDRQGLPLVGAPGRLLTDLLAEIGLQRDELYITNVLKCRPPQNRDPLAEELAHCRRYLDEQVALVAPRLVCTLGTLATKVVRGDPAGIKQVRGTVEIREIGGRTVRLLPVMHPAAALYHRATLDLLRADLALVPELLALSPPAPPGPPADPLPAAEADRVEDDPPPSPPPSQMELF